MKILTVIPTYNEIDALPTTIDRLRAALPESDVLIVDDSSPDGTGELAEEMAAADEQIHVIHRIKKDGLGGAYIAGFTWGLRRDYEAFVELDADGSHQPEQLPDLIDKLDEADLVIGSRWVPGGAVVNWPVQREVISRAGSFYSRTMLGLNVRDITAGFRVFRRSTLEDIDLKSIKSAGYGFQVDMTFRVARQGKTIKEVPITFVERTMGESKMSSGIVLEAVANVTKWGLGARASALSKKLTGR
ncbi:polyprenol monophosphomannose synthase [Nesterenkonia populi]|uniref:polyprenol monophosphomannose synthase n=1 Tax=Nesterenkonia populi TaxID=1591087 RepID=UPI0011BD6761|nr:polyprenol monophosphomannose synthase [Nesterenkonia populi]